MKKRKKYIYPYRAGSKSVKALAEAVPLTRIKRTNSKFRGSLRKTVVNWGATALPEEVAKCRVLNEPRRVRRASNKLQCLNILDDWAVPYTENEHTATEWAEDSLVVCRTVLNGHSGEGIVLASKPEEVVDAPLYTKYIKKTSEWRVHIFLGKVIDIQRKVRNNDVPDEEVNWKIRNHRNGFIYQRNNLAPPESVLEAAVASMQQLDLDFGAVDVIYNQVHERSYVLEVNTAPGLVGSTLDSYVKAIEEV